MNQTNLRATRREWTGLAVLTLPCLLLSMDLTVLYLAVPSLSVDLNPSSAQLLWIVDIYGFLIAGSLITMGTLGDRIGRRRLLLMGAGAFGAASALAAFSTSAGMLIATRALLGVAGATLMPSTLALIRNMFHDQHQRTVAIAVWLNSFMVGSAIGPLLGGFMLEHFWWGSVFLLNVPVMILLIGLGPLLLPEFRDPAAGRLDVASAALSLAAMLSIIYGIKLIAQDGIGLLPVIAILIGLGLAAAFVSRQRTLADPLIDLRLFGEAAFTASVTTQLVSLLAMAGIYFLAAQYLQLVLGLSPLQAGVWLLPSTAVGMLASFTTPAIVRRLRPAYLIGLGLVIAAAGMIVLTRVGSGGGIATIVTGFIIITLGLNPAMTLTTDMIMTVAPPDRAGAASAISETSCELGLALGLAILGSIGAASYRRIMAQDLVTSLPPDAAETARSTLGGAVSVGQQLGGQTGADVIATARAAFAQSLEVVAAISAVMVIVIAVVAVVLLRRVTPETTAGESDLPAAA